MSIEILTEIIPDLNQPKLHDPAPTWHCQPDFMPLGSTIMACTHFIHSSDDTIILRATMHALPKNTNLKTSQDNMKMLVGDIFGRLTVMGLMGGPTQLPARKPSFSGAPVGDFGWYG